MQVMNKDEYKDIYIKIIRAIQQEKKSYPEDHPRVYLTKKTGLISISKVKEVIADMNKDGLFTIISHPLGYELQDKTSPQPHSPEMLKAVSTEWLKSNYPRPVFPMNYWSIDISDKFDNIAASYGSPLFLLASIPSKKGKYKYIYKLAEVLVYKEEVENFELAKVFNSKLLKRDYLKNTTERNKSNNYIKNRLKTLRKLFKPLAYRIKFDKDMTKLIKI